MQLTDAVKQAVGVRAAALVEEGMRVGLGTGSTTAFALKELGRRVREDGLRIEGVPTSASAERLARSCGIRIITLDDVPELDIALDGADEVDPDLNLIKGRGAAHTREKVVAALARRFVILADESKLVTRLGEKARVPVEVLPMAVGPVSRSLELLGGEPELRQGREKDGPVVTDQGFWILDVRFSNITDPADLACSIKALPGVLDHGIFPDMADTVVVGYAGADVRLIERQPVGRI